MATFLLVLLLLVSIFLMFVVLIQRGRGGGLAGAFGGAGGQSAFGTKAGDLFTWITVWTGIIWVLLAIGASWSLRVESEGPYRGTPDKDGPEAGAVLNPDKKDKDAEEPLPKVDGEPKTAEKPEIEDQKPKNSPDAKSVDKKPAAGTSPSATSPTKAEPAGKTSLTPPAKSDATAPKKADPVNTDAAKTEAKK